MQNPFITTFSKNPDISYVYTEKTDEILNNFSYEKPSESVYKITGVRGSAKKLDVTAAKFTASAKEKIEKAGGTATEG